MANLISFRSLLAAAALVVAVGACEKKSETQREADRAAEEVTDRVEDLKEESRELAETAKNKTDDINAIDEVRVPPPVGEQGAGKVVVKETYDERVDEAVDDIADDAKDAGKRARQLAEASNEFRYRKMVRIGTLRAVHAVAASQPMLINAFVTAFPLVEKDRSEVQEKLVIFQMRLDEAGNAIQSLELVEAHDWEARSDAATKAMERVEDSRDDAWEALHEADGISDRTSMR